MSSTSQVAENSMECYICYKENLISQELVYPSCCFQKICNLCDQALRQCPICDTELEDLRMGFGNHHFDEKNSSTLRLLRGENTVGSVVNNLREKFLFSETKLTSPIRISIIDANGHSHRCFDRDEPISNASRYFVSNMRLPHTPLLDREVDSWIVTLLSSGKTLTTNPFTKEEIHRKCALYANRISPVSLSLEYITSRIEVLMEKEYCKINKKTNVLYYIQ